MRKNELYSVNIRMISIETECHIINCIKRPMLIKVSIFYPLQSEKIKIGNTIEFNVNCNECNECNTIHHVKCKITNYTMRYTDVISTPYAIVHDPDEPHIELQQKLCDIKQEFFF